LNDRKLPGLARALDEEAMRALLAATLEREPDHQEKFFSQVRCRVLKHAPGKRCVIAYELNGAALAPRRLIGKIYRKNRGEIIFAQWRQLWQAARENEARHGEPFGMPEPLAYLPELGMLLQSVVPGRQLAAFSEGDDRGAALRSVARNLATLHGLAVAGGEKKTLADHIQKYCHPGPRLLGEVCPELAPLVEKLLNGLATDESLRQAPVGLVHGDLNLAQIFIAGERAWFIDFDGLCLAPPALDLGNFLVTLQLHFGSDYETLAEVFLEEYKACRSLRMLTGLRSYQAFAYLRRAVICTRAPAVPHWRQLVRQLLEAGSAFLEK